MFRRIGALFLAMMLVSSVQAFAEEDAFVLLDKYRIPYLDPIEEGKKLELLEEEYTAVSQRVNTHTMLEAAVALQAERRERALMDADARIYELTGELHDIEELMKNSYKREVAYIVELDQRYRSVMQRLDRMQQDRKVWAGQLDDASPIRPNEAAEDRSKLAALSPRLERQKDIYEKAQACPVLGEVTGFKSPLEIPVQVTSPYGARLDPITLDDITFHHGMDMHAPEGTAVLSAFHGKVEEAASNPELGYYVVVDHGCGIKTLYGHLDSFHVDAGDQVMQYQVIARSGNTGIRTTGPHLHFGIYINGKSVDPGALIPF